MKKVLIAPDSFKGSLSAMEVCQITARAIHSINTDIVVDQVPMADGGEGTVEAIVYNTDGKMVQCEVMGPLEKKRIAKYGILGDGRTAVMEMAQASGLTHLAIEERNPMETTTFGVGQMIVDGLNRGCEEILIGIGGSATNDGGMGMLTAMGYRFFDAEGVELKGCGKNLKRINTINLEKRDKRLGNIKITVACDVDNPLTGPNGATYIFGPQKGATEELITELEDGMKNFSKKVKQFLNKGVDKIPGAGASGGLGAGLMAFLDATLESGFKMVSEAIDLENRIKEEDYDLIITGEGQINYQTLHGKLPFGVAQLGKKYSVPVIGIVGSMGDGYEKILETGMVSVFSIMNRPMSLETAMAESETLLSDIVKRVILLLEGGI